EVAEVVGILPEGIANAGFLVRRQAALRARLRALEPGGVGRRHPAQAGQSRPGAVRIGIDVQGALVESLRIGEASLERRNLPERTDGVDVARGHLERSFKRNRGVAQAAERTKRRAETQPGGPV